MNTVALEQKRVEWWGMALAILPLVIAGIVSLALESGSARLTFESGALQAITISDAHALPALYAGIDYDWPPGGAAPAIALQHFPANMKSLDPAVKKRVFFKALLPLVLSENARIENQRQFLKTRFKTGPGGWDAATRETLDHLAKLYKVEGSLADARVQKELLRRVDQVPPGLVLAQAANESGWGTSRFARLGNNLFGVWTWKANEGFKPRRAPDGATHYVRRYPNLDASVRDYLYNINVGDAYAALRKRRAALRAANGTPTGLKLSGALDHYSEKGARYVNIIQGIMRRNHLGDLRDAKLM
jgi:Bax protein